MPRGEGGAGKLSGHLKAHSFVPFPSIGAQLPRPRHAPCTSGTHWPCLVGPLQQAVGWRRLGHCSQHLQGGGWTGTLWGRQVLALDVLTSSCGPTCPHLPAPLGARSPCGRSRCCSSSTPQSAAAPPSSAGLHADAESLHADAVNVSGSSKTAWANGWQYVDQALSMRAYKAPLPCRCCCPCEGWREGGRCRPGQHEWDAEAAANYMWVS